VTNPRWSRAALSVWGKTSSFDGDRSLRLVQHLTDSADVADSVWDWIPRRVQRTIDESLPEDARDGRRLLRWLAGVHDVGKASPPFASKVPNLVGPMWDAGLSWRSTADFGKAPHGLVGHLAVQRWLMSTYGAPPSAATTYAVVVGGHHGIPPTRSKLLWLEDNDHLVGNAAWVAVQDELLAGMADRCDVSHLLPTWTQHPLTAPAQALLTGAVIVSDWLASNTDFFPFETAGMPDRAAAAWADLGLPPPWSPPATPFTASDRLVTRFPGVGSMPRPIQELAVQAAETCAGPPLLIIESAMGSGKTEAALLAAEVLARRFECGGLFFGLPTMATSDAMFGRVLDWIETSPDGGVLSVHLAHGKAGLNDTYLGLRSSRAAGVHDESTTPRHAEAEVLAWLSGRKKGVLASMVVGTVDQLLFLALQARHAALRHLAFAGKVVVVDEVHAADDYMRMFLCRALEWLAEYGVPAVLLSATLPSAQRQELADAYRSGRGLPPLPLPDRDVYPLLTAVTADGATTFSPPIPSASASVSVSVSAVEDDLDSLTQLLDDWLVDGGCVAVIRNTVGRAQATYAFLAEKYGAETVTLHHSRFVATHRAARESVLREELGRDGARPPLRIVVGTQVLEQSLDIDFDAMVSDVAPIDLVLQRSGRLHRHPRSRPARLARPELVLTGVTGWSDGGPAFDSGTEAVYGRSRLLRAVGVLGLKPGTTIDIALPDRIRELVERGYADDAPVPGPWREAAREADDEYRSNLARARERASRFRIDDPWAKPDLVGWLEDASVEAEDGRSAGAGKVRDSEDGLEVILTQRIEGQVCHLDDGLNEHSGRPAVSMLDEPPHPALARSLAASTVRLPGLMTWRGSDFDRVVRDLERNDFESWRRSPWLQGQLTLVLDEEWRATVAEFAVRYDRDQGLLVMREDA